MAFRYLRDPLFQICVGLYFLNRWLLEPWMPGTFFTSYVNDLLCLPFWVPIMLLVMRKLGLRSHDAPPQAHEIVVPMILWAVMFELWLPYTRTFAGIATADHRDVLCYTIGAFVAGVVWRVQYGTSEADRVHSNPPHPPRAGTSRRE